MIYLTRARLMLESENTVLERATSGEEIPRRVCSQLLADTPRYSHWHMRHEDHMGAVAHARQRDRQILKLRAVAVEQVHRTALVRYLRDNRVIGAARSQTLREFHGVADARDSALVEHRQYLLAASTQICTSDILDLVGDRPGLDLMRSYELAYGQYFGMFCERARAIQNGVPYLLSTLLPEVRDSAERLRVRILSGHLLPTRPIGTILPSLSTVVAKPGRAKMAGRAADAGRAPSVFAHRR